MVHLGSTDSPLCPVTALLASRQNSSGPLFRASEGQPLTKAAFVQKIRETLSQLGLPAEQFAGHSFGIGAATAAAQAGIEDSVIEALGQWSMLAFLLYVRTPWFVYSVMCKWNSIFLVLDKYMYIWKTWVAWGYDYLTNSPYL